MDALICGGLFTEECKSLEGLELLQKWVPFYIFLSVLVALAGAFTGLTIMSHLKYAPTGSGWYWAFVLMAAFALSLNTIWAMHFIGMEAIDLEGPSLPIGSAHVVVPIRFDVRLTIISGVVPIIFTTVGFHMIANRNATDRTTFDRAAKIALLRSSLIITCAICAMHYLGMESEVGAFSRTYSPAIVGASCITAFIAVCAGIFTMLFLPSTTTVQLVSSMFISVAVNGMHYTGMSSATYYIREEQHDDTRSSTFAPDAMHVAFGALLADFLLVTVCHNYGNRLRWESEVARLKKEAQLQAVSKIVGLQSQFHHMAQSLLSALSDAVVTLGPDLSIAHPAPKLALLLFRGNNQRQSAHLEGARFEDLLDAGDHERFHTFISSRSPNYASRDLPEPAQALTVHLLDGFNNKVNVQLFHTCLRDSDDILIHLLGVCEVHDIGDRMMDGDGGDGTVSTEGQQPNVPVDRVSRIARAIMNNVDSEGSVVSAGTGRSNNTSASQATNVVCETEDDADVSVWFNAIDLAVLRCTPGFSVISGPISVGGKLTDVVADPNELLDVVQTHVNSVAYDMQPILANRVHLRNGLRLKASPVTLSTMEYAADCYLEFHNEIADQGAIDSNEEVIISVRAVLSGVVMRTQRARSPRPLRRRVSGGGFGTPPNPRSESSRGPPSEAVSLVSSSPPPSVAKGNCIEL